ncbi:hypothetical protein Pyrfu_0686 [Pyrolobus fumarii 1A]|uniref:Uncharacterized protein n=1 Tax=Pyrolobus fumarii (strain DSM 11204 / 1A) TaxID=694429 RepID=G0EHI0_PYRF1|nr:hypothetical protein [Pyrolobus fumarii]AEM38555.1 hypothetical protein Pyrfu_0686 [Pyrolobus fumarii 1A]
MRRALRGVELAGFITRLLGSNGFYAARHSTSILVMLGERVLASIHVYGGDCILRPYRPYMSLHREAIDALEKLLASVCSRVSRPW